MRKLTLLAVCAVTLAQSSLALSSTFNGNYACRASGEFAGAVSPPVMFLSTKSGEFPTTFSAGTLLFSASISDTCAYSLNVSKSNFSYSAFLVGAGAGELEWSPAASNGGSCALGISQPFRFVLSGDPHDLDPANVVQITTFETSIECIKQ